MSATTFTSACGRTYTIERDLPQGAQGQAFLVHRKDNGQAAVLKLFSARFRTDATRRRIAKLVQRRLFEACPALCAPTDSVDGTLGLGHVAPLAPGIKLDTYLETPTGNFLDHLILAASIAAAIAVLERCGAGHGDLQAENVMVEHSEGVLRAYLIDFDNLIEPGHACPSAGHPRYYAPEIREAVARGHPASPDLCSDRYALGVLMHELLLARHPAAHFECDPIAFDRTMRSGRWIDDPGSTASSADAGGLLAAALDPPLLNLLRRSLAGARADRPAALEWFVALRRASENVYVCDRCRYPCVVDGGKFKCVQCRRPFPPWRLSVKGRAIATLHRGAVTIGRSQLGGDATVSPRHAVLRRSGPDILIQPLGHSPTYTMRPDGPIRLAADREHRLRPGERIVLGSVEATVEMAVAT
jgi:serine/threonine protein kinase